MLLKLKIDAAEILIMWLSVNIHSKIAMITSLWRFGGGWENHGVNIYNLELRKFKEFALYETLLHSSEKSFLSVPISHVLIRTIIIALATVLDNIFVDFLTF